MSNLFGLLDLSGSGLLGHQTAIQVTGHNIANVNTPGYTRQRVDFASRPPVDISAGQLGTGVTATEIRRIYDRFLGVQISNQQQNLGRWEAQKEALEIAEVPFDELSGFGLNAAMSEFWNAWQDLSNNPAGSTERAMLLTKSDRLAISFNHIASDLQRQQTALDARVDEAVDAINRIAEQIFDLNQEISRIEVNGQNANDYRDQRDALLKELSSMIDINIFEDNRGTVTVSAGSGQPLVDDAYPWKLSTQSNVSGHLDVVWLDGDGNATNITPSISGGKLKGWLDTRDVALDDYLMRLDDLAATLITEVNILHTAGFDLNQIAGEVYFSGTSAASISVNPNLLNNQDLIAAATAPSGVPGDNGNARAIANLQHARTMNAGTATFDDFYNSLVSDVGSGVKTAGNHYEHHFAMAANLENSRQSVSGISLDEEMLNLIKFQHAYDAAAKLVSTVDEMLDTVISMI